MLKMAKTRFHFISIISRFQMKDENQGNINKFLLHLMASKELKKRLEKGIIQLIVIKKIGYQQ